MDLSRDPDLRVSLLLDGLGGQPFYVSGRYQGSFLAQGHPESTAGNTGASEGDHEGKGEASKESPELPNLIGIINKASHQRFEGRLGETNFLSVENFIFFLLAMGFLLAVSFLALRRRAIIPKSRLYNACEFLVEGLEKFYKPILGEWTREYLPFVGTLLLFILTMNFMGIVPLLKPSTSSLSVTAGLAICVFSYVQYNAVRMNGIGGYISHLMLGFTKGPGILLGLFFFMPLHILQEFIKPVSLGLRLFGNIMGGHILLGVFAALVPFLPLHFPFMFLELIFSIVQSLIFSILTSVYLLLFIPHEAHESH